MKIGIDSFVAAVPDALTGENLGPADRLRLLLDEIEFADRVGLDVFGVGEHHETPEQIAAHPHPFYTPIATVGSDDLLEPVAYGLKFAGSFSGGMLLKTDFSAKLQAAGVNATAYTAKLPGGETSVILLNKDGVADLEVELAFGSGISGEVETETLHAPALDSREAHITTSTKTDSLKQGKCSVTVPHATGMRVTVI
jgi:hypothetical protein